MKFGKTFTEYLHRDKGWFLEKCSHVEYKRLKKVLKSCRICNQHDNDSREAECLRESCPSCDHFFFSELMREALDVAECFRSRVRQLLHLHVSSGMQIYKILLYRCFKNDQGAMIQEGKMLMEYVTMNAIALQKILKKYDKVHSSASGEIFKSKLRAEHIELLRSPWLIELGAFCLNFTGLDGEGHGQFSTHFSFDDNERLPTLTLMLPDLIKLDYDLTCAICLDTLFNPYALSCGHLFCKSCACSAASVMICEGLEAANVESRCPICREAGVYPKAARMGELDLLLKSRCKEHWKKRLIEERAKMLKQSKEFWNAQSKYMVGAFTGNNHYQATNLT